MTGDRKTWLIAGGATVLLLIVVGILWAISNHEDPQVERVRQLQAKAFADEVPREQRRELFEQLRSESEKLSDEQRRSLRSEAFANRRQEMQRRIRQYFELSAEQRVAYLDEQIDDMEQRRNEWEQRARQREANGEQRRGDRRLEFGRGGGGGRRGNATAEQRNDRRRNFLGMSSATDRAQFMAYIEALNQRREERGLDPLRRGGFGGRR